MIGIEIDRHFNDDILYPMMIYDVYLLPLHRQPIKSKTMEKQVIYDAVKRLFTLDEDKIELQDGWTINLVYDEEQPDATFFYGALLEKGDNAIVSTVEMVTHGLSDMMEKNVIELITEDLLNELKEYE